MVKKHGNQVMISTPIGEDQRDLLKALSTTTRVPQAALVREAIDDLLKKHKDLLPRTLARRERAKTGAPRTITTIRKAKI